MISPFIVLDVFSSDFCGKGLYDPGANISTVLLSTLKKLEKNYIPIKSKYRTVSGEDNLVGITILPLKIFNIEKKVILYVLDSDSYSYDFIIGLDSIPLFKLSLDENLNISQKENVNIKIQSKSPSEINVICNEIFNPASIEEKISHLNSKEKKVISNLIKTNDFVFAKNSFDVGNVTKYTCSINLSSDTYVNKKPYRCTFADQQQIESQVAELLNHGMIVESSSPNASPVTMQFKKDGLSSIKVKTRMCIDYRELNKIIVPESQPFPLIDDIIMQIRGCSWFSALDINAAFWSIPVKPEDRWKTAFVSQQGHYEWRSMPFGLKIAPAVFQRTLSGIIRRNKLNSFCVNYLDDILIFSNSFEEHVSHLQKLMSVIFEEGFRLNLKKCNFASQSIRYLGHIITPTSITPLQDNLIAINSFPVPSNRKNVRQFLGKINFYRKFIPNSASLLEPLHSLLRQNSSFRWSSDCQASFDKVRNFLVSAPILAIFDRTRPVIIYTDASGIGIGAVLKQRQDDGSEKPVAYFSRKLSEAQKKKKAIYIESLAIREAVRYWRFWLLGRRFTVITDHKPLQYLNLKARTDEELGDLAHELLQFDFEVLYRPGSFNSEADCLSRNPVLSSSESSDPILPVFNFLTLDKIRSLQSDIIKSDSDIVKKDVIFRMFRNKPCIVISTESGKKLLPDVHRHFGHVGPKHMINIISKHFYFVNMTRLIREYCASCEICIMNKSRRNRRSGKLGILGPATSPFEIMSLDTIGGFNDGKSPKRYLHLLVDHFSRFAYILCTKGQSAREMITLIDSVHTLTPIGTLLTDQYGGLSSDEFQSYCSSSGIRHVFAAVDSAFSMGLNERLNQTIVNRIRCAKHDKTSPRKKTWCMIAKECVEQYNNSPHSVTGFSPSYLLSGTSSDIIPLSLSSPPNLTHDRKLALENSLKYHEYNKKNYDSKRNVVTFKVGDLVYVENGNKLNRDKLDNIRIGPYPITRQLSNNVFEINVGRGPFPKKLYHASKLILKPM